MATSLTRSPEYDLSESPYELESLAAIIRGCRLDICEAYHFAGPGAALEAVAMSSLVLARYVSDGSLTAPVAFDSLQHVSENLGLTRRFGQEAVQIAIAHGMRFYSQLTGAA